MVDHEIPVALNHKELRNKCLLPADFEMEKDAPGYIMTSCRCDAIAALGM